MDLATLERQTARFAPMDVRVDLSRLPAPERRALASLILAARELDALFLQQSWSGNETMRRALSEDVSPLGRARLRAFLINKGPWSRLDENAPFLPGVPAKPAGANFYPADATREEISAWLASLPSAERERARGFFTLIQRLPNRQLTAVHIAARTKRPSGASRHISRKRRGARSLCPFSGFFVCVRRHFVRMTTTRVTWRG